MILRPSDSPSRIEGEVSRVSTSSALRWTMGVAATRAGTRYTRSFMMLDGWIGALLQVTSVYVRIYCVKKGI